MSKPSKAKLSRLNSAKPAAPVPSVPPAAAPAAPTPLNLLQATEQDFALAGQGALSIIDLFNSAERLTKANHPDIAIQLYRLWLERTDSPIAYAAYFNLSVMLFNINDLLGAEAAYRAALKQKPNFIEANLNLGMLLERTNRPDEALSMWRAVVGYVNLDVPAERAFYKQALNNLGRLLEIRQELAEAETMLALSLKMDSKQADVMSQWVNLRQRMCEWPVYSCADGMELNDMIAGTSVQAMLSLSEDPALQLDAARRYVNLKVLQGVLNLASRQSYGHERLRIGYMSSDFCTDEVSILTAELFSLHDRARVEVYGFSWRHQDGSPLRARAVAGMDHHVRIDTISDQEAAILIRSHEIDILVDLHGLTTGARHDIFSYRPAPIQITWLGFSGTTALPEIDYVLADPFVLPQELEAFFTEKPLHLPQTFQVSDRQRIVGTLQSRESCGLPEAAFVYCAFNPDFKITQEVFGVWMNILKRVPGSILWLATDTEWTQANLCKSAEQLGISSSRLYFSTLGEGDEYLAKLKLADLFLDTFPFNGSLSASDALWVGLPVLTCTGNTFASRMVGSLLRAVNLPELISCSLSEYEAKAIDLGMDRSSVAAMKQQLTINRLTCPLFDSPRFVSDLEAIYRKIVDELPPPMQKSYSPGKYHGYIADLGGSDLLDMAQDTSGDRYVIAAPPFVHNSAGIRVLYDLQKWLVRAGLDAIVCTVFPGYQVEQFSDDIVIYPEVAPGNLFNAKRVIRYILNIPGKLGHGEKTYGPNEVLVAYNKDLAVYSNGRILQVPSIEPFFTAENCEKTVNSVYVGKGQDMGLHPVDCIAITKVYPATRKEMARLLRSTKILYTYDDFSMIVPEARRCGCEVKLIKKDGTIVEFPYQDLPTMAEFKAQLYDFIELTKRL